MRNKPSVRIRLNSYKELRQLSTFIANYGHGQVTFSQFARAAIIDAANRMMTEINQKAKEMRNKKKQSEEEGAEDEAQFEGVDATPANSSTSDSAEAGQTTSHLSEGSA